MNINKQLNKGAFCTDIHFGKKANSSLHNQDCIDYLEWFCAKVKADPDIDYVAFLGDWNENRSALNIATLKYSYHGAKLLNDLNMPVFFIVGNHDLYYRHSREIHSVVPFNEFNNFVIIDEPTIVENIGDNGVLFCPYLFHEEYKDLKKYLNVDLWCGHFEFRGFVITGYNVTMPTGPDAHDFQGPKHIVSGHFHKRQASEQVVYIGNTFPMDFGDAGDNERGMMIYQHDTDEMLFDNWEDCPRYIKTTLSELIESKESAAEILHKQARVKCVVDIPISFEESTYLREKYVEDYELREFSMEESPEIRATLQGTETDLDMENTELAGVNDLVLKMLDDIDSTHIDSQMLTDIYKKL